MKKLLSVALCASAIAAFGSDVEVTLGEVGVTAITSSLTNIVVAVSYEDLATGGAISISNVIKTANLTPGDSIRVFTGSSYNAYILVQDSSDAPKYWAKAAGWTTSGPTESESTPSPDVATLAKGTGFWLVRGPNWDGSSTTFYIYGKPVSDVPVNVAAGTQTLVGNPTMNDACPKLSKITLEDRIYVPDRTIRAGQKMYKYTSAGWRTTGGVTSPNPPTIPAGTGFWYVPKADSTVSWQ